MIRPAPMPVSGEVSSQESVATGKRPSHVVTTAVALDQALDHWRRAGQIGLDTESNGFHAYRERLCLLQVSTRDADWIVDPLAVSLAPLGGLLADPAIDVVVHAGDLEVQLLAQDLGIRFSTLFDTAIAAKALGFRRTGLATLASELLGIALSKDEQRSDWSARPLSQAQIAYALADTRYLLPLADSLRERLSRSSSDVQDEVVADALRLSRREVRVREVDPEAFERHALVRRFDGLQRQILRHLYAAREERAQSLDRALFRVAGDELLGQIALEAPADRTAFDRVRGMTPPVLDRVGELLWSAVQKARAAGPLDRVRRARVEPDPAEEARFESLRGWRRQVAEARGVEVEVIAGNAALKALARHRPTTVAALEDLVELDPLRRRLYGEAWVSLLSRTGG